MSERKRVNWFADIVPQAISVIEDFHARGARPSLRAVFYALVSNDVLPNNMGAYKGLGRTLVKARQRGLINWTALSDPERETIGGDRKYEDPEKYVQGWTDYIKDLVQGTNYHFPRWWNQPAYVEVWIEKRAQRDIISGFLRDLNIPIVVCRGYPSWTLVAERAQALQRVDDRELHILYLGDYDPSGRDIFRFVRKATESFGLNITFELVAITREQIRSFNLPNRPEDAEEIAKMQRDPRYKNWEHGLFRVELDALFAFAPDEYRVILRTAVMNHFDQEVYADAQSEEADAKKEVKNSFKETLKDLIED